MKTRTTLFAIAGALMILMVAVPLAFAQRMHAAHDQGEFGSMMMLGHLQQAKADLGLSDQQVSDLQAVFKQAQDQNATYRQQHRDAMHQIMQTLLKNPNDLAGAQALLDQQTESEKAMKSNLLNAASKALNVLSADQRAKLGDLIAQHMANRSQQK
jgi:Spy/CpxP family protein refolding chaperone